MAELPPRTAASAIADLVSDFGAALFLQRPVFDRAAAQASAWRKAAVVVIIAALASDSLGLYSDTDEYLVRTLAAWSLVPIMVLALARWAFGTAVAKLVINLLAEKVSYQRLLRPAGLAYAPAVVHFLPALVYWLDLLPVTHAMVSTARWLSLPWLLAALAMAAQAAGVSTRVRAVTVAIVLFVAANLFDVLIDAFLFLSSGSAPIRLPADAIA